jgi:hypothetical protein
MRAVMYAARVTLILSGLAFAACHRGPTSSVEDAATSSSVAHAGAATTEVIDACAFFTPDLAREALGGDVRSTGDRAPHEERSDCTYTRARGGGELTVTVTKPGFTCENLIASERSEKHPELQGIGQVAFRNPKASQIVARWGVYDVLLLAHDGSVSEAALESLAKRVIAKIPATDPNACVPPDPTKSRCKGESTPCRPIADRHACNAVSGCYWIDLSKKGECEGIPSVCAGMTYEQACQRQGCRWQ